jgi:hypothetical protein
MFSAQCIKKGDPCQLIIGFKVQNNREHNARINDSKNKCHIHFTKDTGAKTCCNVFKLL